MPNRFRMCFCSTGNSSTISCLSVSAQGGAADSFAANPAISADGHFTAFELYAGNLLPNPYRDARRYLCAVSRTKPILSLVCRIRCMAR